MKTLTWHVFICTAMVLGASGLARADERNDGCSSRTLRGTYVFSAIGIQHRLWRRATESHRRSDPLQRRRHAFGPRRDAQRQWRDYPEPRRLGTYTVEDDCTGTITFNGPAFDAFISRDGDTISMIQTNPGTVFQGTAKRRSRERDRF